VARAKAAALVDEACNRLEIFAEKAEILRDTARFIIERRT